MSHPKTCRRLRGLRAPYDDILANYPICTALDWELRNPLSRRNDFLNEVDVTYSMISAKCRNKNGQILNLLSNGWSFNITLSSMGMGNGGGAFTYDIQAKSASFFYPLPSICKRCLEQMRRFGLFLSYHSFVHADVTYEGPKRPKTRKIYFGSDCRARASEATGAGERLDDVAAPAAPLLDSVSP